MFSVVVVVVVAVVNRVLGLHHQTEVGDAKLENRPFSFIAFISDIRSRVLGEKLIKSNATIKKKLSEFHKIM